jgi:hypothetical protein
MFSLCVLYGKGQSVDQPPISECQCDERLKTKLRHWVVRGTGTPKDKDEVNRREVSECDG